MTSVATLLQHSADGHGERTALIHGDERTSYADLWADVLRAAAWLRTRIAPGDRVVLQLPNSREWVTAYYGVLAAGGVAVPLHFAATETERHNVIRDSGATVTLLAGDIQLGPLPDAPSLATPIDRDDDDPAAILYTSGTSGDPKGVVLTHRNLLSNATVASRDVAGFRHDDVMLVTVQFAHAFGMTSVLNACLYAGATLVLTDRWHPPTALDLMRRHGVTVLRGVPTIYVDLLDALGDAPGPAVRAAFSGGASLPVPVLERVERAFSTTVWEGYGLTEASPLVACNQRRFGRRPGTVGHAVPGVEIALADPAVRGAIVETSSDTGEIVVRGPNVMAGYWRRPAETAATIVDGWLRTGDIGARDDDGFLCVVDRVKDIIKRGGAAVYPREVEDVLRAHDSVRAVAVVGLNDDRYGECVAAFVVAGHLPADDDLAAELDAWCRATLAAYKCPSVYEFVDGLPLGPTGKVLKRVLRAAARSSGRTTTGRTGPS
jgi:long-chain acyl-CoA synthetase